MIRPTPLQIVLWLGFAASIVAFVLLPSGSKTIAVVIAVLFAAANIGSQFLVFRNERRAIEAVVAAHPGETAMGAGLFALDGVGRSDRARVRAVVATSTGLSFRDGSDTEVAQIAASRILSLELGPLEPRRARPVVATLVDGSPAKFFIGGNDDKNAEAVMAMRAALGRTG